MGIPPRQTAPVVSPTRSAMPNFGTPRPATPAAGATAIPGAAPAASVPGVTAAPGAAPVATNPANPAAPAGSAAAAGSAANPAALHFNTPPAARNAAPAGAAPHAAPDATTAPKSKSAHKGGKMSKKTMYILIGCLAIVIAIICIIAVVVGVIIPKQNASTPTPAPEPTPAPAPAVVVGETPLEDLEKDGLLSAFDTMYAGDYTPTDYIAPEIADYLTNYELLLADSYSDPNELPDRDFYGDEFGTNIVQVDDTFAIITPLDDNNEVLPSGTAYITFDVNYLDYDSSYVANDVAIPPYVFVDTSEEFVAKALPVLLTLYDGVLPSTIYSYEFNSTDDGTVTLDLYSIAIATKTPASADGTIAEPSDDSDAAASPYLINGGHSQVTVAGDTGEVIWTAFDDDAIEETIVSFPLTADEGADRLDIQTELFDF